CPANSHYEPCAAACPATCVDPMAPHNCSLPCVEGCVCDSGYLLYNDRCVPSQQCGCWHNGQHYPVGSEFWTDDTCSSKCTCPARGSKVQCFNASCPAGQYCGVQDGKPVCLEHSYGICHVHGDPHYKTFDRVTHNFMGNCTYTLAKVCSNTTSLPYFNVEAKNEHRGNTRVSYVREVMVEVYGQRIVILKKQESHVNNVRQTLPVSAAGGAITVSKSGRYIVVETDFNLRVSYDTDHSVEVKVPTTYFNLTCGMCGNFNNRRDDEYMMPNGQQATDSNALGESWQVPDSDPSCGVPVPSPPCSAEEENLYRSDQFCGMLTTRPSAFERCHGVINPQDYFDTCLYDLCALNGGQEFLCAALEAYADACQAAGVTLLPWRNATFCPLQCPPNSYYDPCMTGCPATCADQQAPQNCSKPCVEGCACSSGFLLSGDACVPEANCGCLFEGNYYTEGESSVNENCTRRCRCEAKGQMVCSALSCGEDEVCKIQDGQRGCYPASTAVCHIYGDPHYHTFDKQLHHFMGTCTYTLSKLCDSTSSLPYFNVEAANEHRGGNTRVSYVRYVDVDVADQRIRLGQGGVVTVNGVAEILPCSPSAGVQILSSGFYTMVMTDFGLRVKFDGKHRVEVTLPSTFGQKVCGMCGNYNGMAADDFQNPEGAMEPDSTSLGNSWEVSNNSSCSAGPLPIPACTETDKQLISSSCFCGLLNDTSSPFKVCHAVLSPSSYFDTCFYDLCELGLDSEALCKSLQSYADACQSLGVQIPAWRNATFCPITCPANSHYEPCAAACPATCVDPMAPHNCSLPCVEGCVCDSGYLLYNDRCVPSQQCGCWHNGQHYPVGSEFWTDDTCSSKCTCPARGSKVQCFNASCPAGQYCGVQDGKPVCLEHSYGICHVHGDPHYKTFDRVTHNFMGNCTYTLAKVCSNTTSLPYFNVEAKNEHRGNTRVSYVREVMVEVYGQRIVILKKQESHVLVNNVRQTLPVSTAGGAITVSKSGRYIVVETDFNLRVSYDTDHSVEVKVPTTYFNLTCGMCGNFNN
ncbi:ZAN protein, partial [Poecile atricapillus]|nr:ZAN protein [Poecile atricapillus]